MSPGTTVTLFLSGDVMTGRGIDQVLPHPGDARLYEPCVRSAAEYVELAESVSGPIPRRVGFDYVWGDARQIFSQYTPDARIVNLETAVTANPQADPDKQIHYRMHPANVPCLAAARIDCCVLANNHVLDWGRRGLSDTLHALHTAGIRTAGAGLDAADAAAAAVIPIPSGRLLVYGWALWSSGTPGSWRARRNAPGVNWLAEPSRRCVERIRRRIELDRRPTDLVIVSLHWGGNWGYEVSSCERQFARDLIDRADVHLVHGHSSHHPRAIEIHHRRAILYGCGDLLNDYEGIRGYESFRPELGLMYFPRLDARSGELVTLTLVPVRTRRFRLQRASVQEAAWMTAVMDRECRRSGTCAVELRADALVVEEQSQC